MEENASLQHTSETPRDFTFHLLKRATDNFSKDLIIGYGGCGIVYKGVLDNGEEIAVKKLYNNHLQLDGDKQFNNECINLMRVQHQNIVRLVGYCHEIAHKIVKYDGKYVSAQVEERALCFEYLQSGSLDKHLSDESCGLGWRTRYQIIRGICEGLHHLHNGSQHPIYHLDLKPANILLDQNMMPKIGDFGLSRLFDSTQTHTTGGIRGTHGYMPPEYINRFKITPKFDIFSLGVIIIQIMAGREGYSKCGDMPSQVFIQLVHENWLKTLQVAMSSHIAHEVKTCIEIALRCVETDREKRPTIAEIVDELNKIDIAKRSSIDQLKMAQMQQQSSCQRMMELQHQQQQQQQQQQHQQQQQRQQQQQQQMQQNTRKRKPTSSGPANSTGTGNTVGPSPPSTRKSLSLSEVGSNRTSNNKVVCCHFSTDGKLLASAGHEKKVFLSNMDTFNIDTKLEEHTNFITDIRFRPNSTQLATSSSDGTVRLWNAVERTGALQTFHGHTSHVTSVDFHPKITEILCSCDDNGELRLWTVGQNAASRVTRVKQGGIGRVRFQPRIGKLLAVAAGNTVNIIDVDTATSLHSVPKDHSSEVNCICWDKTGEYLASVSQDSVKVWSVSSAACIHELRSHGNQYHSCVFHPRYPKVLIVGGYQTLELWSMADNQRNVIPAHEGMIAALAHSPLTGSIASASHDRSVKLWK